jgi:hypothetical protein
MLGMRGSLIVAAVAAVIAFAMLTWAAAATHVALWQWLGLAIAATAWTAVLFPWLAAHQRMTPAEHQKGMYAALVAWAITDLAVIAAFAV